MGVAGQSRDHVEAVLADLEGSYESFAVTQTTVSVSRETYERTVERCEEGVCRVDVHVQNQAGEVLVVETEDGRVPPGETVGADGSLEREARRAVEEATGVECHIDAIEEVTIAGIHDETETATTPVYRILVLVTGRKVAGSCSQDSSWAVDPPESELLI